MNRSLQLILWLSFTAGGMTAWAQSQSSTRPAPPTAPDQAKAQTYWLQVIGEHVNLRSRPDRNSTAAVQVDRDMVLQGVEDEFGWHKVLPPAGSFSYVAAEFVDQVSPEQGVVSVREGQLRVRVGSLLADLDPSRSEVQIRLQRGSSVRILGRSGDWLKIVPPEGVYFYVLDEFVDRITPEVAANLQAEASGKRQRLAVAPATRPAETRPAAPDLSGAWGQRLVLVETMIDAESRKPPREQSWAKALAELRPIVQQREEPVVARLAREWVARLEQRVADLEALKSAQAIDQRDSRDRSQYERELEHIQRARQSGTQPAYVAQGLLRQSLAVQGQPATPRYKLLDPLSGKLVAYLEVSDRPGLRVSELVNRYIGVRGERRFDKALGADVIRVGDIELTEPVSPGSRPARQTP